MKYLIIPIILSLGLCSPGWSEEHWDGRDKFGTFVSNYELVGTFANLSQPKTEVDWETYLIQDCEFVTDRRGFPRWDCQGLKVIRIERGIYEEEDL